MLDTPTSLQWLYLDHNSYFASVEQQCRPETRGKPVAVVPLETDATCAIAASYESKALGIKTGTRIYEAKKLCPELICIQADHARYVEYHHRILAAIERHIPVAEVCSIDEVACELDALQITSHAARKLAYKIKQSIYTHAGEMLHCSIGIAPNRFLAKVATELEKPNGLAVILPEEIPQKLFSLTFDDIPGIGRNMQKRLYLNGISTIEQLYHLPPKHLRAIWHSVAGERLWYQLRGIELEREPTTRRTVGHSHVLAPENRPYPQAQLIAHRLLLKAASRMRRFGYDATVLSVSFRLESGQKLAEDIRFAACCDSQQLQQHYAQCLHKLMLQSPFATPRIKKIAITLHGLAEQSQRQADLFSASTQRQAQQKNEQLSAAMDAINKKYGRNSITTAATLGQANQITGTKIAFSRIPDVEEFFE